MKKMLILGYFGYVTNQLDGQTVKTRSIYNLLSSHYKVSLFDTEALKYNKSQYFILLFKVLLNRNVIYLGGESNLKVFFPWLFIINKIIFGSIVYIVVGGWLYDSLISDTKSKTRVKMLSRIKHLFVETQYLKSNLNVLNINNVSIIPNFRVCDFIPEVWAPSDSKVFRIVFMARMVEEKGIYKLLTFYNEYLKEKLLFNKSVEIDFFGPFPSQTEMRKFTEVIEVLPGVEYKGVLEPEEIYSSLNQYDVLALPTHYAGEGFPGTIVDSYLSGLPVIATKWKQIPEFIDHGITGFLIDDERDLFEKVMLLCNDDERLIEMKISSFDKSKEYGANAALKMLQMYL